MENNSLSSLLPSAVIVVGMIYAMYSPASPYLYKMGYTTRPIKDRVCEVSKATGVLAKYDAVHTVNVIGDPAVWEKWIHTHFDEYRENASREGFGVLLELHNIDEAAGIELSISAAKKFYILKKKIESVFSLIKFSIDMAQNTINTTELPQENSSADNSASVRAHRRQLSTNPQAVAQRERYANSPAYRDKRKSESIAAGERRRAAVAQQNLAQPV